MSETLIVLLNLYRLPAVFVGAFFFGDSVILTTAFLAGQQQWSPLPIFLMMFLGTAISDTLWFFGGVFLASFFAKATFMRSERQKAEALLEKLTGKNPLYVLIFVKFLYGSRIAMILYTATRGISFRFFTIYNSIGILVWLAIFFPLGYLSGMGIGMALPPTRTIEAALTALLASIIGMRAFTLWLSAKITKK